MLLVDGAILKDVPGNSKSAAELIRCAVSWYDDKLPVIFYTAEDQCASRSLFSRVGPRCN